MQIQVMMIGRSGSQILHKMFIKFDLNIYQLLGLIYIIPIVYEPWYFSWYSNWETASVV
jgi:hypothetical protein